MAHLMGFGVVIGKTVGGINLNFWGAYVPGLNGKFEICSGGSI